MMKKYFTLLTIALFAINSAFSQCVETPKKRVLLIGDSWASFLNADQTINTALKNAGHSDKQFTSTFSIAENGADTWDFVAGPKLDDIQNMVDANPDIDMIHLSIGGNDLLGDWNVSFTQEETDALAAEVEGRLLTIVDFLQNTREGMRVFWAGYTYPNFGEVINDIDPFQSSHPFYSTWDGMGQPTFIQVNTLLNEMSDSVALRADNDPKLDFVMAQGILQYTYGQSSPLGITPGGTYQPFELPLPLGYPNYPSPKETMRLYGGIFTDAFHLSPEAYLTMISYQTQKFYQKYFMDDLYLLSKGGAEAGSVSSTGDVSGVIKMGEEGGAELAAVLSFETENMADTTLESASIFLRLENVSGSNPISSGQIQVKMVNGNFGATVNVEADDFSATATATGAPCRFGSNKVGNWIRLDLPSDVVANINNQSSTQFIISVPGFTGGTVTFSDASDPELAPILNLNYSTPAGVANLNTERQLSVYPIPTTGPLTIGIDKGSIVSVEVINILGSVVLNPSVNDNRLDISELPNGTYILRVTTQDGVSAKRIVKQ